MPAVQDVVMADDYPPEKASASQNAQTQAMPKRPWLNMMPLDIRVMIFEDLDIQSLARLASTCHDFAAFVEPYLYKRDAKPDPEGGNKVDSSAIKWATMYADASYTQACLEVLRRSAEFGGDINAIFYGVDKSEFATALHFACGTGNAEVVESCLSEGADVMALSSGYSFLDRLSLCGHETDEGVMYLFGPHLDKDLKFCRWLPLLLPMLRGQRRILELLAHEHAPPFVACLPDPASEAERNSIISQYPITRAVTIYHIFALMDESQFHDEDLKKVHRLLFARHREDISVCTPRHGMSPLHMTIRIGNGFMMRKLTSARAYLEVGCNMGRTPLLWAIMEYTGSTDYSRRSFLLTAIRHLIDSGANVNCYADQNMDALETPLLCAVDVATLDNKTYHSIANLVEMLLNAGANIAEPRTVRFSALHAVAMVNLDNGSNDYLESLLKMLVRRGGDINAPMIHSEGSTILFKYLKRYDDLPYHAIPNLLSMGANIQSYEADDVLELWVHSSRMRSPQRGYDVFQHGADVSEAGWKRAFVKAFKSHNRIPTVGFGRMPKSSNSTRNTCRRIRGGPTCTSLWKSWGRRRAIGRTRLSTTLDSSFDEALRPLFGTFGIAQLCSNCAA
ncbi:hypothetical protein XA68_14760 [Ophiocordyceps unilateralis]|uniref:F-box domain-containing protein n=1 Tax=Ophiocordyceps unilateralis TaxID=268505 RepID=A0A2A9P7Z5_OPHUN|nr:hypothetical protein XA68_14760 [Ophiocordyceps unilateralis]